MEQALQNKELTLLVSLIVAIMILLALAFILLAGISQRKILKEQMKAQALQIEYRENLLHTTILTQEEERKRIAKDLHDDLGSKLNVLRLNLNLLKKHSNQSELFLKEMNVVKSILDQTINTTRKISHELLPPTLQDFGLPTALEELCNAFHSSGVVGVELTTEELRERLPEINTELQVFRVVQELINNSLRHGGAQNIFVHLTQGEENLQLSYRDDGSGFDVSQLEEKKGLGLKNIDSRLHMIGGQITYESSPGNGLRALIQLNYT